MEIEIRAPEWRRKVKEREVYCVFEMTNG